MKIGDRIYCIKDYYDETNDSSTPRDYNKPIFSKNTSFEITKTTIGAVRLTHHVELDNTLWIDSTSEDFGKYFLHKVNGENIE
jgi:hypothetical protein